MCEIKGGANLFLEALGGLSPNHAARPDSHGLRGDILSCFIFVFQGLISHAYDLQSHAIVIQVHN
jgi:hypothetical protein